VRVVDIGTLVEMIPLRPREKQVLNFMAAYWREYKNVPFVREIVRETGISRSTVEKILVRLTEKYYLDRFRVGNRLITIIVASA